MKLLPILLLPALVATVARTEPDWKSYSTVVPALEKRGHAYMIQVDAETNDKPWKAVALAVHNSEILFAEYQEKTGSARFYSRRGGRTIRNNQFFLLQEDFMALQRRHLTTLGKYLDASGNVKEAKDGKNAECKPVMFEMDGQQFMPILDKPGDRTKHYITKRIGTYFVDMDEMAYWDIVKNNKTIVNNVRSDFINGDNRQDRVEFLCRTKHVY